MSLRLLAFAALGVVAGAIVPSTSHAQLGKLTKKATDAASNAAGVPTGNARYVKKIDLTSAQLVQVNKGLAQSVKVGPETIKKWEKQQADHEKANADYEKANADYTKKKEKYDQCVESEKEKAQGKIEAANNKASAANERTAKSVDTASMMTQAQAAQAAAERVKNGTATAADRQTLADFQKTMAGVSAGSNALDGSDAGELGPPAGSGGQHQEEVRRGAEAAGAGWWCRCRRGWGRGWCAAHQCG